MPTCTACGREFTDEESVRCEACGRGVHDACQGYHREFDCRVAADSWVGTLEF